MERIKKSAFILVLYLFPLICLASVVLFHLKTGIGIHNFMREPQAVVGVHPSVGAISNLGVLFWCATATILLFTWSVRSPINISEKDSSFFLFAGILTVLLTIDDLFMVHEAFLPTYFGLEEIHSYIAYIILFFLGFIRFKKQILNTQYYILLIVFGFWGLSIIFDFFQPAIEKAIGGNWRILLEDGFKFLGIVAWFDYFSRTCLSRINQTFQTKEESKPKRQKKKK